MKRTEINELYNLMLLNIKNLTDLKNPILNMEKINQNLLDIKNIIDTTHDEYENKHIQSIYETNEIFEFFNAKTETEISSLIKKQEEKEKENNDRIIEINKNVDTSKKNSVSRYKFLENKFLEKSNFLYANKKTNKDEYIKETTIINKHRINDIHKYEDLANDLSSTCEQQQYKFKHTLESAIEKNEYDKQVLTKDLERALEEIDRELEEKLNTLNKDIKVLERIAIDNTVESNASITKLSEKFENKLKYAYIPYDIEKNKFIDQASENSANYSAYEEQVLEEFKTILQQIDDKIENARKKERELENTYLANRKSMRIDYNTKLKKIGNTYSKEINLITNKLKKSNDKELKNKLVILRNKQKKEEFEITSSFKSELNTLDDNYYTEKVKMIKLFEQLRAEKNKAEAVKSNAMKNINNESSFYQAKINDSIKSNDKDRDTFTTIDKYEENKEIFKLRLESDLKNNDIRTLISETQVDIMKEKYDHRKNRQAKIYEKEYKEQLFDADLKYQEQSINNRLNYTNVSSMLNIQKEQIKMEHSQKIHNLMMAFEQTKMDFYNVCDNIQYELYKYENDFKYKWIDLELENKIKISENEKQYINATIDYDRRMLETTKTYVEATDRVALYKRRLETEKTMFFDAYELFLSNIKVIMEFESFLYSNMPTLTIEEFDEHKKSLIILVDYIYQIKSLLLKEYFEEEVGIINSRINFEKGLKYNKILQNIKLEEDNLMLQLDSRLKKLEQTITSYKNTIKMFEETIKIKKNEVMESSKKLHDLKSEDKEKYQLLVETISDQKEYIQTLKRQISVNEKNIIDLSKTKEKIILDIESTKKKYDARYKNIEISQENDVRVYRDIISIIRQQFYRLQNMITKNRYLISANRYTYLTASSNSNMALNNNNELYDSINSYYNKHMDSLTKHVGAQYVLLEKNYIRHYQNSKKNIDKEYKNDYELYKKNLKSLEDILKTNKEALIKQSKTEKNNLLNSLKQINNKQILAQENHYKNIEYYENLLCKELQCHEENMLMYTESFENKNRTITKNYLHLIGECEEIYKNNLHKLALEEKNNNRSLHNQRVSNHELNKSNSNELNDEYKVYITKTNNKIKSYNVMDKKRKASEDKTNKENHKIFNTTQKETRKEFDVQVKEINKRCEKRIKNNIKEFDKKFKKQK